MKKTIFFATLAAALSVAADDTVLGDWAFDVRGAHWLRISASPDGGYTAEMLWNSSPQPLTDVRAEGGLFYGRRELKRNETVQYVPGVRETFGVLRPDGLHLTIADFDANGRSLTNTLQAVARRLTPPGPAPDLSRVVYGEPVDLLSDGLAGWKAVKNGNPNLWKFVDGQLVNDCGEPRRRGVNLRSCREDFFDFALSCEVKLPKKANSGIYLRGRYEIQLIDSLERPLDGHAMGAFYGRIVPAVHAERAAGEWQTLDVVLCERHVTVVLNGVKIIDNRPVEGITGGAIDTDETVPGPIVIQGDHSDVAIRKLVVRPIVWK